MAISGGATSAYICSLDKRGQLAMMPTTTQRFLCATVDNFASSVTTMPTMEAHNDIPLVRFSDWRYRHLRRGCHCCHLHREETVTQPICADCKTSPAVLKRGREAVCLDCYHEQPLRPLAQWDKVINPSYILSLEERIQALEATVARLTAHRGKQ